MKIKSRDVKLFLTGGIISWAITSGLVVFPLDQENRDLKLKNEQRTQINNDLMSKNKELIGKNSKKSKKLIEKDKKIEQLEEKIKDFEFKSVNFNPNDITQPTNIKAKQLEILFKSNSTYENLIGLEKAFVDAEEKYGVNAIFLLSLVSQESNYAKSSRAINNNNLTGYAVYSNDSEGRSFNSKYDSILSTARLLREDYLNENGKYFKGLDIYSVNSSYCVTEDKYSWSRNIISIASTYIEKLNAINSQFNA
ncbi:S-layer protein [[Clostridium] sordellii]|uniref:glucosaminidase domain-containing protein n=1 Tax=Paraclostridium sordellii TaxID=1505 RepID=UPI0005DEEC5F|nr:glucosaminidase domain-containing protein [Paeniclostridium sordellii]CEQ01711.1 S-layer protein [[Clostridium] sordellii] [Paeniclostridium sordellii]